jgi:hypothetical protein
MTIVPNRPSGKTSHRACAAAKLVSTRRSRVAWLFTACLATLASQSFAQCNLFSDSTFDLADWTQTLLLDSSSCSSSVSVSQAQSGGSPGSYLEITFSWGQGDVAMAFLRDGAIYDPASQGAISSLAVELEFYIISGSGSCGPGFVLGCGRPVIMQGSSIFFGRLPNGGACSVPSDGWTKMVFHLSDFGLWTPPTGPCTGSVDTSIGPDTSATALPLEFGLAKWSCTGSCTCVRTIGYDNFSVSINADGSWSNFGTGVAGTNSVPALTASNPPVLGQSISLEIGNSLGTSTSGLMFVGLEEISRAGMGGTLYVGNVVLTNVLAIPSAGLTVSGSIVEDPLLCGTTLYLQVIEADPGALSGVSFSQGLQLDLGK